MIPISDKLISTIIIGKFFFTTCHYLKARKPTGYAALMIFLCYLPLQVLAANLKN
jgi:Na+(H+)/acetate symporter ActP